MLLLHIKKMSKISKQKFWCVHVDIIYVYINFHRKQTFFVMCKKDKEISREKLF
jgi:hypothetical protein